MKIPKQTTQMEYNSTEQRKGLYDKFSFLESFEDYQKYLHEVKSQHTMFCLAVCTANGCE